ncbi:acyltransferase family protein [Desmospora profundinema]|uniref:Membrane-bound acyltransferase YfiQ involved in biofilm formation n=1 Tax=Desmospora profundinema TaxID=1571184 RepID=A0ABU1IQ00_9BACL|nr:acyltransferase family protein [Desmospora profundinema]MDR6226209.1 membrane-bound acyltransferase YfiQ involved in biofilm formation [Desmospora profundinema]
MSLNQKGGVIQEVFFLRFIACLSVVWIHAISVTYGQYPLSDQGVLAVQTFQMAFMYATPLFVCISELLLAHAYPNQTPRSYWEKRVKYILLPFFSMAFVYALIQHPTDASALWSRYVDMVLLGKWHGYFIMIIFQFYLLHALFIRWVKNRWMVPVLTVSFAVNFLYLSLPAVPLPFGIAHYIPFVAWIFYFTVSYYIGRNLSAFRRGVERYRILIFAGVVLSLGALLYLKGFGIVFSTSSKRPDVMIYTVFILCFLFWIGMKMKEIPRWMLEVGRFSFGIYLLHPLVQHRMIKTWLPLDLPIFVYAVILFMAGVLIPIALTWLMNQLPLGAFVVGKLGKGKRKRADRPPQAPAGGWSRA